MESSAVLSFLVAIYFIFAHASPTVHGGIPEQFADIKFTCDLYSLLSKKQPGENIFFSPFSITSALAMLKVGAGGKSAEQIQTALGLTGDQNQTNKQYSSLRSIFEGKMKGKVTLKMANKLYASESKRFSIDEGFNRTLATYYGTSLERLNFGEGEAARNAINRWVEQVTENKIKELFPSGSIDDKTRVVIANTIYFKGGWEEQFRETLTRPADFFVSESKTVKVDMMQNTAEFHVAETDNAYVLDLPYKGYEVIMTLVVPKEKTGLTGIERALQGPMLKNLIMEAPRTNREVELSMPKFKIESSFGLKDFLIQIGIKDVFTPGLANLTGMTSDKDDLYVEEGYHKAFLDVNENGTEAAAATGLKAIPESARIDPPPRVRITVDHPSLVVIRHRKIVEPLFFGRLVSPPATEAKSTDSRPVTTAAPGARKPNPQ